MTTAIAEEFTVAIELKSYPIPEATVTIQVTLLSKDHEDPVFLTDHFDAVDDTIYWHGPLDPEALKDLTGLVLRFDLANWANRVKKFRLDEVDLQIARVADLEEASSASTGPDPDVARDDEGPQGPVDPDVAVDG